MSPAPALPESVDLQHHLTKRIRAQQPSAMKAMGRLLKEKKSLLSLGGGMPHPSLFPMSHATFTMPTLASIAGGSVDDWKAGTAACETFHLKKTGPGTEDDVAGIYDLNEILQYGLSNGFPKFMNSLLELNEAIHGRTIVDASVYITCGNTDGVSKVFQLFVEPGVDTVLTEEYSFGSSLNNGRSKGAKFYPIKTDADGMDPEDLETVLSEWDESKQGPKPHLMYTIPCGQNPTGTVMPPERYERIYQLCCRHDVIIMEDDPYFALQYQPYEKDSEKRRRNLVAARETMPPLPPNGEPDDVWAVAKAFNEFAGIRSYLSRDIEGRVLRIDTFSKVFGPGMRSGWVSCNSLFMERLMRVGETSTQVPNNLGQAVLASYLSEEHWGVAGFIRWMWAVRLEYQAKRDFFLDHLEDYCPRELVSTAPCGGGMFQFLEVHVASHPRFRCSQAEIPMELRAPDVSEETLNITSNTRELMDELWTFLVQSHSVLVMPAKLFQVEKPGVDQTKRLNFFRATFAGDMDTIDKALCAFGAGVKEWFQKG